MKYLGWVLAGLFLIVIILNQLTIREYKLACKDYRKTIEIYERMNSENLNTQTSGLDLSPTIEGIEKTINMGITESKTIQTGIGTEAFELQLDSEMSFSHIPAIIKKVRFIEIALDSKEIFVIESNGNIYGMNHRFIGKLNDEEKKGLREVFFQFFYGDKRNSK